VLDLTTHGKGIEGAKAAALDLILEHLRGIRGDIGTLSAKVDGLTQRVGSLEEHIVGLRRDLGLIHGDIANTHQRLDHHVQRLDRIEKRLALAD
jgi:septal ring factor EnvC (AmiA/AmiB activator)